MPIQTSHKTTLKMCFWNTGGLISKTHDKTTDPLFLKEIEKYDLVFLAETHLGYDNNIHKIGPFYYHPICRPASKHNRRHFGGLAILRTPETKPYVKILKNTNQEYQWVKLEKDAFGFSKDLYICLVYYPPIGSAYTQGLDQDILDCIEKDLAHYKERGNILLCGDFNARTSTDLDFITNDDNKYTPIFDDYSIDRELLKRFNKDKILDSRGKDLLELCTSHQLRILNGRVLGDVLGHFTCYTPNGASVVDYVIVSEDILSQIFCFKVAEFIPTLSDTHCKLEWVMSAKFVPKQTDNHTKLKPLPPNYIWSEDSCEKFQLAMNTSEIQTKLSEYCLKSIEDTRVSLDGATDELTNIILQAANNSLKRRKVTKNKNRPRNKKWFDCDLKQTRHNLINYGKIYSKFPKDTAVKNHYYKLYREYKRLRKFKYKEYKQSILDQLESLHENNPKLYWNLVNELRQNKGREDKSSSVDPSTWVSHFKNLNEIKDDFKQRLEHLESQLDTVEKEIIFNELDMRISLDEISKAIGKLKYNKSPGLDNISNNMLKSGKTTLLPCLHKLFNFCLSTGNYPKSWAEGYVSAIHKSNDITDPNNYRGIAVTSAIGKLFNSILNERLDLFLEKHKIINKCQLGFTKKARTSDHLFILKCILDQYCNSKDGRVFACFVDFQKAFDTIIHTGIKIKLLKIGVGSLFYRTIKNMYEISKSCVKIQSHITDFFPTKLGVKQGDNLSPNLFKVFINDLPDYLENTLDPILLNGKPLHCLMYADDIILLSSSAKGLQEKLNILGKYCDDWCLTVNPIKTKIMVFNKAGRHIHLTFNYKNHALDCVQHYKYLGVYFSASGSFSFAQNELYKKGLKAYFKLQKDFLAFNPSLKTSMHVFDHTIKPILLYGSEIWGSFNTNTPKFRNGPLDFDKVYNKLVSDKLHVKFCKQILGVHKKTTNFAVLSELGRFPIHFDIVKNIVNYWIRLENLDNFPLLQDAYIQSKKLNDQHKSSWYGSLRLLLSNIPKLANIGRSKISKDFVKKAIKEIYLIFWKRQLTERSSGKLRTYLKFKTNPGFENYLSIVQSFELRRSLTKFRVSAHRLEIESGRYRGIPPQQRFCKRCDSGEVEDEIHFLICCSKFNDNREQLFVSISKTCKNFVNLNTHEKFIWLMNCEDPLILKDLCKFMSQNCK